MGTGPEKAQWAFIKAAELGREKRFGSVGLGKVSGCKETFLKKFLSMVFVMVLLFIMKISH